MQRLYRLAQPLLFTLPAETAHHLGMAVLRLAGGPVWGPAWQPPTVLRQQVLGLEVRSPVGLAAGFDKDALRLRAWPRLGFGFVEVGTVTPRPQPGNPKPRLLRLRKERSLQNWMGFNGRGVDFLRRRLVGRPPGLPVGVNIGKNADTPNERAGEDYRICAASVAGYCDFLVINVSSPNTPGLRTLQRSARLQELLRRVTDAAPGTPVLVKLSPDEELASLENLAGAVVDFGAAGVVVNNTSVDYSLARHATAERQGGLSGRLIRDRSRQIAARVGAVLADRGVVVSVGGIDTAEEVYLRMRHGATLVEVYTGLVYEGPELPRRLAIGLAELMDRDGVKSLDEIIGADL